MTVALTHTGFPPQLLLRRDFSEARRAKESLSLALTVILFRFFFELFDDLSHFQFRAFDFRAA